MTKKQKSKIFTGSKPSEFYNADYYLNGVGSNYGRKDEHGNIVFSPYDEASYLPNNRKLAAFIASVYKPKTALVLGCARAYLVLALRELGVDAKGIDISQWAIDNAPAKIRPHLFVGDICDLSRFKTAAFDLVTAFDVFEHITVPDLYTALGEASRVCKDTLVIDVPIEKDDLHPDQSSGTDKSHVSVYSEQFWINQFTASNKDKKGNIVYHIAPARSFILDGKEVYTYPEGNQGATLIFRKIATMHVYNRPPIIWHSDGDLPIDFTAKATGYAITESEFPPTENSTVTAKKVPLVSIIMLNWNGLKFTPNCIETLYRNTDYPFHLTVVDNQSTDGSQDWLNFAAQSYPNMEVVYCNELNSGFADGVNIGLKFLNQTAQTAPYVLLLNNDTIFMQKNWLSLLVAALEKDSSIGIVSPKLLYPDGRIQYGGSTFTPDLQPYHIGRYKNAEGFNVEREVPWATFACALIRRELLFSSTHPEPLTPIGQNKPVQSIQVNGESVIGLDNAYKLGTFEDVDFCTQTRFNGYKILYCPQAKVYHYEGATVFTVNKAHYQQQQQANAQLFYGRWRDWLRMNRNAYPELYTEGA
jgi:hypothetical protein